MTLPQATFLSDDSISAALTRALVMMSFSTAQLEEACGIAPGTMDQPPTDETRPAINAARLAIVRFFQLEAEHFAEMTTACRAAADAMQSVLTHSLLAATAGRSDPQPTVLVLPSGGSVGHHLN